MNDEKTFARDFGTSLKACRLGFHYSATLNALVRMSYLKESENWQYDEILVEVSPRDKFLDYDFKRRGKRKEFICWWENTGERAIELTELPLIIPFSENTQFRLNAQGKII